MKKILCAVLALAAMASCSKEYIVAENKQAIAFGEAFVNNGTRADYSSGNDVQRFYVYGTVQGEFENSTPVQIFKGAEVERPDDLAGYNENVAWVCEETQYWVPNAVYNFTAVVDGELNKEDGNYLNTINFTVEDGNANKDLLLATADARVNNAGVVESGVNSKGYVAFSFNHLLSKVMFTVNSNIGSGYSIDVTGISVTGVAQDGIYTVGAATPWAKDGDATTTLTFGRQGAYETRQILPVEQTLNVTISYDIYFGGTKISAATKSGAITKTFAVNTVYNIVATITMTNEIEFTVKEVIDWVVDPNNITL